MRLWRIDGALGFAIRKWLILMLYEVTERYRTACVSPEVSVRYLESQTHNTGHSS